jgi:uncharacterized protein YegJ (DUF2314 family)
MVTVLSIVAAIIALRILWWWFVGRNVPKFPPLAIDDDDPAMLAARQQARESLSQFRALITSDAKESQVKVPFKTNGGQTEHLWAEVLSIAESAVTVRYLTPPVSHTGQLEREHVHPISDIEDWAVINRQGKIHGGYTQRVMFQRAREQWGALPPELEKQASQYVA